MCIYTYIYIYIYIYRIKGPEKVCLSVLPARFSPRVDPSNGSRSGAHEPSRARGQMLAAPQKRVRSRRGSSIAHQIQTLILSFSGRLGS